MRVKDLRQALEQHDDDALVFLALGVGQQHALGTRIRSARFDEDCFEVRQAARHEKLSAVILKLEE